ncbi:MAG: DUF2182 domain-containing protein [Chloroflexi bacterium]|nr:DUF2182 domain-containing protein [Chloroflexota bacterium]
MNDGKHLGAVLKRDRRIVLSGLAGVSALAWIYLVYLSRRMANMDMGTAPAMPQTQAWQSLDLAVTLAMWVVMMVAMMAPSATPAALIFAAINRKRREAQEPHVPTAAFLLGYLVVWIGFGALATLFQWGLHTAASLSPGLVSMASVLGGVLLAAAGLFQWTSLKRACLAHCRSPQGFFVTEWQEGMTGALLMGVRHGLYCVGCCWLLMCLLFLTGVMNLLWTAIIAAFILLEKVAPAGQWVGRTAGLLLIGGGLWMTIGALL